MDNNKDILQEEDKKYEKKLEESKDTTTKLVSGERIPYKPAIAYRAYFPNGKQIYFNGILISLIFDGRTYMLPPLIVKYIEKKLETIVLKETIKEDRFLNPKKYEMNVEETPHIN